MKPNPIDLRILAFLHYDPETGLFTWCAGKLAGCPAGTDFQGYRYIQFRRRLYAAHRVAWLIMTGVDNVDMQIDHHDRDKMNNRWGNLRLATSSQNSCNRVATRKRNSLPKGVHRGRKSKRYTALIRVSKKLIKIGLYDTAEEAAGAYAKAASEHFGEFARTSQDQMLARQRAEREAREAAARAKAVA